MSLELGSNPFYRSPISPQEQTFSSYDESDPFSYGTILVHGVQVPVRSDDLGVASPFFASDAGRLSGWLSAKWQERFVVIKDFILYRFNSRASAFKFLSVSAHSGSAAAGVAAASLGVRGVLHLCEIAAMRRCVSPVLGDARDNIVALALSAPLVVPGALPICEAAAARGDGLPVVPEPAPEPQTGVWEFLSFPTAAAASLFIAAAAAARAIVDTEAAAPTSWQGRLRRSVAGVSSLWDLPINERALVSAPLSDWRASAPSMFTPAAVGGNQESVLPPPLPATLNQRSMRGRFEQTQRTPPPPDIDALAAALDLTDRAPDRMALLQNYMTENSIRGVDAARLLRVLPFREERAHAVRAFAGRIADRDFLSVIRSLTFSDEREAALALLAIEDPDALSVVGDNIYN